MGYNGGSGPRRKTEQRRQRAAALRDRTRLWPSSSSTEMSLPPGTLVDRYVVLSLLGTGGMGDVYEARDPKLQRLVALKVLRGDSATGPDGAARLLREARAVAALSHPNVLVVHDVGEVREPEELRGVSYIAMERVIGRSLRSFIGDASVPMARRIGWIVDTARALGAAHEVGLVHRDVKPENVMVGDDGVVKVLDFGLARRVGAQVFASASSDVHSEPTLRRENVALVDPDSKSIAGTMFYMAPEQLRGEPLDGRTDQFSWGVLAYELVTGAAPWRRSGEPLVAVSEILSLEPRAPRDVDPMVPAAVSETILKAMSKRAVARFGSMREIVESLGGRHPTSVHVPTSTQASIAASVPRTRPAMRRAVLTLVAGCVLLGTAVALWRGKQMPAVTPSNAAVAAPRAAGILDLPLPRTNNPDALAAYRMGLQKLRDGNDDDSGIDFQRAAGLDPGMAEARLRMVLSWDWTKSSRQRRDEFTAAYSLRAGLSDRDLALLDAMEPMMRDPYDIHETAVRMRRAHERFPLDAEVWFEGCTWALFDYDDAEALRDAKRASEIDPSYASAWALLGHEIGATYGDPKLAFEAFERCLTIVPQSHQCLTSRAWLEDYVGNCSGAEADDRQADVPDCRAAALAALGAPRQTIDEVLSAPAAKFSADWGASILRVHLDVLNGSFSAAELEARGLAKAAVDSAGSQPLLVLAHLLVEMGRTSEANRLATDYLARKDGWHSPPLAGTMDMLGLLRADGYLSEGAWKTEADRAFHSIAGRLNARQWVLIYGRAESPAEAAPALARLPDVGPLNRRVRRTYTAALAGHLFLLDGRIDEAIALLAPEAKRCDGLFYPFEFVHASLWLGEALEAKGDAPGACAAYKGVLDHWGHAKPRSVSADKARGRAKALHCWE
jgi:serine/threonine protein kinase